jgi:hypothetical protein
MEQARRDLVDAVCDERDTLRKKVTALKAENELLNAVVTHGVCMCHYSSPPGWCDYCIAKDALDAFKRAKDALDAFKRAQEVE